MPERYGKWKSADDRFNRRARDGTIDRILERLHLELDDSGRIDFDLWCIDGTSIRASRVAAGAGGEKRDGRAGRPGSRPLARRLRDEDPPGRRSGGVPLSAVVTAGQAHESSSLEPALEAVRIKRPGRDRPRRRPRRLAGNEGYSYRQIRRYLRRRGIKAVIPARDP